MVCNESVQQLRIFSICEFLYHCFCHLTIQQHPHPSQSELIGLLAESLDESFPGQVRSDVGCVYKDVDACSSDSELDDVIVSGSRIWGTGS